MPTVAAVVEMLKARSRPDNLAGMARFGMAVDNRLGVAVPDLRRLARQLGRDHALALDLWETGIAEARIVASMIDDPARVTPRQMDRWVKDLDSWDVCDQVCMNLFDKTPHAWAKVEAWSTRKEEFVKRAAFALLACLAWHDKTATDEQFINLFPVLKRGATDDRNFVKKAVSWALRNIGKRSPRLNKSAISLAKDIARLDSKAARWVASDALKELQSPAALARLRVRGHPQKR